MTSERSSSVRVPDCSSFEEIAHFAAGGHDVPVAIAGASWTARWWDSPTIRKLVRPVPSGAAEITTWADGRVRLTVALPDLVRASVVYGETFDNLDAAAEAAERFRWKITELAGHKWYCTREAKEWVAVLGVGDVATVALYGDDGAYSIKRLLSPRHGESYELSAYRHDSVEGNHAVRTFAEAAAIAVTLPAFVAVLGAANR